jgi:PHD/YefM family antitoxin component YafN of YafNO toxin-antitoxin module
MRPASITSRDIQRNWRTILDQLHEDGKPCLITRGGKPYAVLWPVSDESYRDLLADLVLATSPQVAERLASAEEYKRQGKRGKQSAAPRNGRRPATAKERVVSAAKAVPATGRAAATRARGSGSRGR